jgi:hypothetical protein
MKTILTATIKGGALIYSLIIATLVSLALLFLMLFQFYSNMSVQDELLRQRLNNNVESGIRLLLSDQQLLASNEDLVLDLFDEGTDSVHLWRKHWGAYEVISCQSFSKNKSVQKTALVGSVDSLLPTLYLSDKNKALSICGKTIITGQVYLPLAGVKRAYIEGQTFEGEKMIDGEIKVSKAYLPTIDEAWDNQLIHFFNQTYTFDYREMTWDALDVDSLVNGFQEQTMVINNDQLSIQNMSLTGNIIIQSAQKITIAANCMLNQVLIIAPEVTIKSGFVGNVHILASHKVIIEEGVTLTYPSSILLNAASQTLSSSVLLSEKTEVHGVVALLHGTSNHDGSLLEIKKGAQITGMVYAEGYVQHEGAIDGSLYCNKIFLKTPSAVYESHLLNATLTNTLPNYYCGLIPFKEGSKKIMTWLN